MYSLNMKVLEERVLDRDGSWAVGAIGLVMLGGNPRVHCGKGTHRTAIAIPQ